MAFQNLTLDYTTWKAVKTSLTPTVYYVQTDSSYLLIIVDTTASLVSLCQLIRIPTTSANVTDFETNIKGSATLIKTVDQAIASEVY